MRKQLTDKSLVHRHTDKRRNLIINRCSTDLEKIINGHNPETGNLNNDVLDRLDKMALEIEAHLASREAQQAATPTAQEAMAVMRQWPDPLTSDMARALERHRESLHVEIMSMFDQMQRQLDYSRGGKLGPVHPPQPSETVAAVAIAALAECIGDMEAAGLNSPARAHAALRALKGDDANG